MSEEIDIDKAKTVGAMTEALTILAKYMDKGMDLPAEGSEDGLRLIALGWHLDGETDGWAYFT